MAGAPASQFREEGVSRSAKGFFCRQAECTDALDKRREENGQIGICLETKIAARLIVDKYFLPTLFLFYFLF